MAVGTTWNPADLVATTLSGGNLITTPTGQGSVRSIYSATTGKYYFEVQFNAGGTLSAAAVGVANSSAALGTAIISGTSAAFCTGSGAIAINGTGQTGVSSFGLNGFCCVALDMGSKLIWFRPVTGGTPGTWNGSGTANPATGVGGYSFTTLTGGSTAIFAWVGGTASGAVGTTANFGDSAFSIAGAVPAGFNPGFGPIVVGTQAVRVMVLA